MNKKLVLIVAIIIIIIFIVCIFNNKKTHQHINAYLYESNGLYGLEDENGNKITDAEYKKIIKIENIDNMFIISDGIKYGMLTSSGEKVINLEYDNISADEYIQDYENIGYILSLKKEDGYYFGYANRDGKIILQCDYEEVRRITDCKEKDIYLIIKKNGRCGICKNGKIIVEEKYRDIFYNSNINSFIIDKNGKYGLVDLNGKELIKPKYEVFGIEDEKIYFITDDKTIYYDKDGNFLEEVKKNGEHL